MYNHKITMNSSEHTPMDDTRIPYGHIDSVDNTDFDLRQGRVLTEEFLNANGNEVFRVSYSVALLTRCLTALVRVVTLCYQYNCIVWG